MTPTPDSFLPEDNLPELVTEVEQLNDELRSMALSLALYLAKAKSDGHDEQFAHLEPELIRLVNAAVAIVREVSALLQAAKNMEALAYDEPSGDHHGGALAAQLGDVLNQCTSISEQLASVRTRQAEAE